MFRRKHWKIKEVKEIDKDGEEITKYICYILLLVDSARPITSSLSNLVNNLSIGVHEIKCKFAHNDKKCETRWFKYKYFDCCILNTLILKMI